MTDKDNAADHRLRQAGRRRPELATAGAARAGADAGRPPAREAGALRPRAHPRARRARQGRRRARLLRGDRGRHEVHAGRLPRRRSASGPRSSCASRTVGGEKGSADAERDPRGFAIKFYTEEGNYDMVGNNTPVFFIRDPLKFPRLHPHPEAQPADQPQGSRTCSGTSSRCTPESIHQVTILFSDRGTPDGYRHMNGFSSHTFMWYNAEGEHVWVQVPLQDRAGHREPHRARKPRDQRERSGLRHARPVRAPSSAATIPSWQARDADHDAGARPRPTASTPSTSPRSGRTRLPAHHDRPPGARPQPGELLRRGRAGGVQPAQLRARHRAVADKMLQGRAVQLPRHAHRHRLGPQLPPAAGQRARRTRRMRSYQRDGVMRVDAQRRRRRPTTGPTASAARRPTRAPRDPGMPAERRDRRARRTRTPTTTSSRPACSTAGDDRRGPRPPRRQHRRPPGRTRRSASSCGSAPSSTRPTPSTARAWPRASGSTSARSRASPP